MKLVEELIGRAQRADQKAGDLAQREANALARREAYARLESTLEDMTADGVLDPDEIATLMAKFREAGLSTEALEDMTRELAAGDRVVLTDEMQSELSDQIRQAKRSTNSDHGFQFEVQQLMSEYHQSIDLAATVQKKEHDMYMTAINNMKA